MPHANSLSREKGATCICRRTHVFGWPTQKGRTSTRAFNNKLNLYHSLVPPHISSQCSPNTHSYNDKLGGKSASLLPQSVSFLPRYKTNSLPSVKKSCPIQFLRYASPSKVARWM